jgi:hypothetical protein
MNIIFVGGIYYCEFSLFKESQNNPKINVVFCTSGESMPDAVDIVKPKIVTSREDINKVKDEFNPDLTLFRTWNNTEIWVNDDELLWSQEINPTLEDGSKEDRPLPKRGILTYQNKVYANNQGKRWLPYCVSKYWGYKKALKDIPVLLATNLPDVTRGGLNKRWSLDVLFKPLVDWDKSKLVAYQGFYGGLDTIPYIKPILKPTYRSIHAIDYINRAKIYVSPSTILYDEGSISHKTIEAMACGVCTITNNYVGVEEIVGKDHDTILYSNSPEETLDKVKYYLTHDSEREALAKRAYEYVHKKYNWEDHFNRLIKEIQ